MQPVLLVSSHWHTCSCNYMHKVGLAILLTDALKCWRCLLYTAVHIYFILEDTVEVDSVYLAPMPFSYILLKVG